MYTPYIMCVYDMTDLYDKINRMHNYTATGGTLYKYRYLIYT